MCHERPIFFGMLQIGCFLGNLIFTLTMDWNGGWRPLMSLRNILNTLKARLAPDLW